MEDFLLLDHLLSVKERLIRDNLRRFITKNAIPLMADAYETAIFPLHLVKDFAQLGLFGLNLSVDHGGSGASAIAYGLVCQELERGDSSLRSFVSVQNSLCLYPIAHFGSHAQQQQFIPELIAGKQIGCFGLTETDSGSDPNSLQTTAKKVTGGWILNGAKLWITNATLADVAIVWAKTMDGIRGFLVEKTFKGFSSRLITKKMALRASNTGELIFDDCFVPDDHYLPGSEIGLKAPLQCLTEARFGIAWGAIGAAQACYEAALSYCQTRRQFNRPLSAFQLVQKDLVTMFLEIQKAQWMNFRLGQLKETGKSTYVMVSLAKLNACKEALNIARLARNLLGANGISLEYPVIRHMENLEAVFTYEGTDNIHHLIVGEYLTGIDSFCSAI